jgi:hypothetical protein
MQRRSREVVTTAEIKAWIPPAAFPADGDMLADEAQVRGGPQRLVAMLRRLPAGRVYQSIGQTARALRALRHVHLRQDSDRPRTAPTRPGAGRASPAG